MSKSISFGFSKPKPAKPAIPADPPSPQKIATKGPLKKPLNKPLLAESDSEDESAPRHESVTGFDLSNGGAISSGHIRGEGGKEELVIPCPGNENWRRRVRAKKRLLSEVQAQRHNARVNDNEIERDEISKAAGLQYAVQRAEAESTDDKEARKNGHSAASPPIAPEARTEDEIALQALLNEGSGERRTDLVIQQSGDANSSYDEVADLRADIASRPDSCTLEEYEAMPVEEFGLAMLRGMGKKRKANGEPVEHRRPTRDEK